MNELTPNNLELPEVNSAHLWGSLLTPLGATGGPHCFTQRTILRDHIPDSSHHHLLLDLVFSNHSRALQRTQQLPHGPSVSFRPAHRLRNYFLLWMSRHVSILTTSLHSHVRRRN